MICAAPLEWDGEGGNHKKFYLVYIQLDTFLFDLLPGVIPTNYNTETYMCTIRPENRHGFGRFCFRPWNKFSVNSMINSASSWINQVSSRWLIPVTIIVYCCLSLSTKYTQPTLIVYHMTDNITDLLSEHGSDLDQSNELTEIPIPEAPEALFGFQDDFDDGFGPYTEHQPGLQSSNWSVAGVDDYEIDQHSNQSFREHNEASIGPVSSFSSNATSRLSSTWNDTFWNSYLRNPMHTPRYPWEVGFANLVFGPVREPIYRTTIPMLPSVPYVTPATVSKTPVTSKISWSVVKSRVNNIHWDENQESMRRHALQLWTAIIQIDPESSEVGRQLLADINSLKSDVQLQRTVTDIFASKSTATMIKRAQHFSQFIKWTKMKQLTPFPIKELDVYSFLYDVGTKAPTFPSSFRQALNFAGSTIGLRGAMEAASSSRVAGFAHRSQITKRPLKQAQPLKVSHIKTLERVLLHGEDVLDATFSGQCLMCVNLRARWSDGQFISSLEIDAGENLERICPG